MPNIEFTRPPLLTVPNVVSLSRLAFTPAVAWAILQGRGVLALGLFALVVTSDMLDGFIARRRRQVTRVGTLLDHGADAIFVISMTALCAHLGLLPSFLSPLIALAFIQYVLDSHVLAGAGLRASVIGRWNGIAYFAAVGSAIFVHHYARGAGIVSLLWAAGCVLAATTVISITERAVHLLRRRRPS